MDNVTSYEVIFPENLPEELEQSLKEQSQLLKLKEKGIRSYRSLALRARHDIENMQKVLKSYGYFKAKVKATLKNYPTVIIKTELKERFRIGKITASQKCFTKIKPGDYIDAKEILEEVSYLTQQFQEKGYAFVHVSEPQICILEQKVDIHFPVFLGKKTTFGEAEIKGLEHLSPSFVRNRLLWKKMDLYHPEKEKRTRRYLLSTGLFSRVDFKKKDNKKIYLKIKEASPRVLGANVRYSRSLGIEGGLSFKHYNLRGHGESLNAFVKCGKYIKNFNLSYEIPDFKGPRQSLSYELYGIKENLRAYKNKEMGVETRLQIPQEALWTLSLKGERAFSYDNLYFYNSSLFVPSIDAEWGRDLDGIPPEKGFITGVNLTPYIGFINKNADREIHNFYKMSGRILTYLPLTKKIKWCSFLKGTMIPYISLENIPPNKRLFAGGIDSVRAYGFQLLGPLDAKGNPRGWTQMMEYGTELRYKYRENIDVVGFFEGACVTQNLTAAGYGLRYISEFGILRGDVAFPFKRRSVFDGVDKPRRVIDSLIQIYVGVGQTF